MEANLLGIAVTNRVFHSPQYKNAIITNFDLAVPLEINKGNEVWNLEIYSMWKYKFGNKAIIDIFCAFLKKFKWMIS